MAYTRDQLIERIRQVAAGIGFDPNVAVAQHHRESRWRNDVIYGPFVGRDGERGVSQFTPGTWARFGSGPHTNAYDPDASLAAWSNYISYLMRLFNGDYTKVLQGYNGGEGHVPRGTVSAMAQRYAREILAEAGAAPAPSGDDGWQWFDPNDDWLPADYDISGQPTKKTNWLLIGGVLAVVMVVLLMDD